MHRSFKALFKYSLLCLLTAALEAEGQNLRLTGFVYNDAEAPLAVLNRAESRASDIFFQARFDLEWVNCGTPMSPESARCATLSDSDDVVIRILPRANSQESDAKFGMSFLGPDGKGRYSDVFWDKVLELQNDYKGDIGAVLGSVMAHEIGHLMLGSHSHSISGIMRARWDACELQRISMGTLVFLPDQEKKMRDRYTSYAPGRISALLRPE